MKLKSVEHKIIGLRFILATLLTLSLTNIPNIYIWFLRFILIICFSILSYLFWIKNRSQIIIGWTDFKIKYESSFYSVLFGLVYQPFFKIPISNKFHFFLTVGLAVGFLIAAIYEIQKNKNEHN